MLFEHRVKQIASVGFAGGVGGMVSEFVGLYTSTFEAEGLREGFRQLSISSCTKPISKVKIYFYNVQDIFTSSDNSYRLKK